jgi:acyl carrier protein
VHTHQEVIQLLDEILSLKGRSASFTADTPLLGAVPELDSMAVVALIAGLEEHFGFVADDDEIDGSLFATVGTLTAFVDSKRTH